MKVSSVALSAVLGYSAIVAAVPQGTTSAAPSTVSVDPAVASVNACLKSCNAGDVYCQAHCENLPTPDNTAVQATHDCISKCPQGNGTKAETDAFAACEASCVSSLYYTASSSWSSYTQQTAVGATPTNGNAGATGTGSPAASNTGSGSGSGSPSGSGSGSSASPTGSESSSPTSSGNSTSTPKPSGNAASSVNVGMSFAGVVSFVLAALAL